MDEMDIPIFQKTYDLYKEFYGYRNAVPKTDRYALWQKCETALLDTLETLLLATQLPRKEKLSTLEKASLRLNMFRVFVRLCKETKVLDEKKYIALQGRTDEIGRMLGGWIRSSKTD